MSSTPRRECMVLKMTKFQHITAAVRDQLHWLPVKQSVEFKQALFVYKVLRQTAPPYFADIVSTRVNEFHTTPSSLGRSPESRGTAMQNNKIRKAKFSRVCSINLELTTDDRSWRFYFQSTFESWTVSQSLWNRLIAPMWQLSVNSLREHKYFYLLVYLLVLYQNGWTLSCFLQHIHSSFVCNEIPTGSRPAGPLNRGRVWKFSTNI